MPRKQSLRETPPRKFEAEGSRIDAHGLESRDPIEPGAGGRGVYLVQSKGIGGVDLGDWCCAREREIDDGGRKPIRRLAGSRALGGAGSARRIYWVWALCPGGTLRAGPQGKRWEWEWPGSFPASCPICHVHDGLSPHGPRPSIQQNFHGLSLPICSVT